MGEPIPVPTTAQVVVCMVCQQQMVISLTYVQWEGHPGYRHTDGHPNCRRP